jgi:signal transduction histidine kinase
MDYMPHFIRNTWLVILIVWAFTVPGKAQNSRADSLKNLLRHAGQDTSRVNQYYAYGELFETDKPDSALYYYGLARTLAAELKYVRGQAAYASHAITILNTQGKFREALELTREALGLYEKLGSRYELCIALINVGSEWHYLSDFQQAADYYLKALALADEGRIKKHQRVINNNLASIFINLKDYKKGEAYAEKSLQYARELKNDYAISSSMYNIATAALYLEQYDKALALYQEIESIGLRTNDFIVILDGRLGMADVYNAMLSASRAERHYQAVVTLAQQKDAPEYEMYAYMGLSDLYLKVNRLKDAREPVRAGIVLAQKLGSNYELKDLYLRASALEEKNKNYAGALDYRKKFEVLNDTIIGEKSRAHIHLLEARFESEKKEATILQLESDKEIQKLMIRQKENVNYVLAGLALLVMVISILLFRNYRQKQILQQQRILELEREKKLAATEAVLKGEEQERTRLAQDLHDGLGGMLSGIKYALNSMKENLVMTSDNQLAFERSIDMLDTSIKEMRRVAHNMMPESLIRFGMDIALRDFCLDITKSQALKVRYQSIGLAETELDQTLAVTVYRIAQELINNTMKHASATHALVQVTKTDNILSLTVEDNGKGFDTNATKSNGIGWTNIRNRVDFLKGTLDVSSTGEGTSVHIEFNVT